MTLYSVKVTTRLIDKETLHEYCENAYETYEIYVSREKAEKEAERMKDSLKKDCPDFEIETEVVRKIVSDWDLKKALLNN